MELKLKQSAFPHVHTSRVVGDRPVTVEDMMSSSSPHPRCHIFTLYPHLQVDRVIGDRPVTVEDMMELTYTNIGTPHLHTFPTLAG